MAPELLPLTIIPGTPATQKGDVYSFAIILEEIVVRGGPYETARQYLDAQGKPVGGVAGGFKMWIKIKQCRRFF